MFENFFQVYPDFTIVEKPSENLINEYATMLPKEIIHFWKDYGFGTFMNGYLRIINPDDYIATLFDTYDYADREIPIAVTAFGDILCWQGEAINFINYRFNYSEIIAAGEFDWFLNMDLTEESFLAEDLKGELYEKAKNILGELAFDECYGFVPLLALGGPEKAENLQKVNTMVHLDLITQLVGTVE
ncbi:T6SS immunity protein Tdi1 domain-containing protein [Flavobacterium pedocola]